MDKLGIFRSRYTNFKNSLRIMNNTKQHKFEDKWLQQKDVPFKHSWANLAHMHDLRLWTIAYAPSHQNNLQRL